MWGIAFGLPLLYHPDEPAYVLQALAVGRGLPDGLTFANPPLFNTCCWPNTRQTTRSDDWRGLSARNRTSSTSSAPTPVGSTCSHA